MPDRYLMAMTTTDAREDAERLARDLVERRVAACVQVLGPMESRYWWEGRLESATEWLCLAKTTADRVDEVVAAIEEAHSYDTPEVLVTGVVGGNGRYLRWVEETVILDS